MIKAVLWDFGGVITSSPFEAFNRYELSNDIPRDFIRSVNATNPDSNAWAKFESSLVSLEEFDGLFAAETEAAGYRIAGLDVLNLLSGDVRPEMVVALGLIKESYRIACLTNNVKGAGEGPGMAGDPVKAAQIIEIMSLFDFVIESSKVGFRKPNPRFYELACEQLAIDPTEAVFLDDLGINLKPAKAMGMATIKVTSAPQALTELSQLLSIEALDLLVDNTNTPSPREAM
ncbi:MAG: HAD-IA family hydrolase [Halieaceae bacterium]|jgi:putative hydrolase of the HAD superfamily|nr:HAD-IA family hydrolase [Halieaceae bacterium]